MLHQNRQLTRIFSYMIFFNTSKYLLTRVSSGGTVENNFACKKACREKLMHSFQMQDFYYFAEQLNQTNFHWIDNRTEWWRNQPTENLEFCTDVKFDFQKRKWTDGNALQNLKFIQKWETKFDQLWDNLQGHWPVQPYQPEFVLFTYN